MAPEITSWSLTNSDLSKCHSASLPVSLVLILPIYQGCNVVKMKCEINFSKLGAAAATTIDIVLLGQNVVLIYLIFTNKNTLTLLEMRSIWCMYG